MAKHLIVLQTCLLLTFTQSQFINISCTSRWSDKVVVGNTATVSCLQNETLVSCGVRTQSRQPEVIHKGAWIDPTDPSQCSVDSDGTDTRTRVVAIAYCCTFPPNSIASVTTEISQSYGELNIVSCPETAVLTGCQVKYESGMPTPIDAGLLFGAFIGNTSIPSMEGDSLNPNVEGTNICVGQGSVGVNVSVGAQCIHFRNDYSMQCKTGGIFTNGAASGNQPKLTALSYCKTWFGNNYFMTSCNAWGNTTIANTRGIRRYYMGAEPRDPGLVGCVWLIRDDDGNLPGFSTVNCCEFMDTPYPTLYPTSNPTIITSNPTVITSNPTIITSNPTVITSNPTVITTIPTSNPTASDDSDESSESSDSNDFMEAKSVYNLLNHDHNVDKEQVGLTKSVTFDLTTMTLICFIFILVCVECVFVYICMKQ